MSSWLRHVIILAALAVPVGSGGPSGARACDVALVLAVDVSGSVDSREYRLQADGLALSTPF